MNYHYVLNYSLTYIRASFFDKVYNDDVIVLVYESQWDFKILENLILNEYICAFLLF